MPRASPPWRLFGVALGTARPRPRSAAWRLLPAIVRRPPRSRLTAERRRSRRRKRSRLRSGDDDPRARHAGRRAVQPTFFVDVIGDSLAILDRRRSRPRPSPTSRRSASPTRRTTPPAWCATTITTGRRRPRDLARGEGPDRLRRHHARHQRLAADEGRRRHARSAERQLAATYAAARRGAARAVPDARISRSPGSGCRRCAPIGSTPTSSSSTRSTANRSEKAGVKYIDIWDAFANQNGEYDAFGPNIDGQNVKLRGPDGIHFTKAGGRKVAHFLEADIRRAFEEEPAAERDSPTCRPTSSRPPTTSTPRSGAKWALAEESGAPASLAQPKPLRRADLVADRPTDFARRRAGDAGRGAARPDGGRGARAAPGRARRSAQRPRRRFLLAAALASSIARRRPSALVHARRAC